MNVFYSTKVRGLKQLPAGMLETDDHGYTVYFTQGDVYLIDCEGQLYSAPRWLDGSFDTQDFDFVDFDGHENPELLTAIGDVLHTDAIHDPSGWYFKRSHRLAA